MTCSTVWKGKVQPGGSVKHLPSQKLTDSKLTPMSENTFVAAERDVSFCRGLRVEGLEAQNMFLVEGRGSCFGAQIAAHMDYISHCKTASGTFLSNTWIYRACIIDTRRDSIGPIHRCQANMAHTRQSRPDPGLDFHAQVPQTLLGSALFARRRAKRALPNRVLGSFMSTLLGPP